MGALGKRAVVLPECYLSVAARAHVKSAWGLSKWLVGYSEMACLGDK